MSIKRKRFEIVRAGIGKTYFQVRYILCAVFQNCVRHDPGQFLQCIAAFRSHEDLRDSLSVIESETTGNVLEDPRQTTSAE